jgi:hypothetical protein
MWQGKDEKVSKNKARQSSEDARKYLANHPAKQGGVNKADEDLDGHEVAHREREAALAKQVLVYHESQSADTGNDWMFKLKEESMKFLAEQAGVDLEELYRDEAYKKGIEILIDKMFGILQRYMFEFNQIASGTDLQVTGTISGDVTEVTRYNQFREAEETKTYFRARLSTKYYSLTIRGADGAISFYLVPTNMVMALSKVEKQFKAIACMQVKITNEGMMWRMRESTPPTEGLDELCMWLFSNLIQETKAASKAGREEETTKAEDA